MLFGLSVALTSTGEAGPFLLCGSAFSQQGRPTLPIVQLQLLQKAQRLPICCREGAAWLELTQQWRPALWLELAQRRLEMSQN